MNPVPLLNFENMRNVEIHTIDPFALANIRNANINSALPFAEKAADYLKQIGNPYCFRCDDVIVKIEHSQTVTTIDDCMEAFFRSL